MTFDYRYETKFVLTEEALAGFLSWMYVNTSCRKKYPARTVNSLYFDDVNFTSVRDNLAGVPYRMKTRLRWYISEDGNQISSTPIWEKKLKVGRLGTKETVKLNNIRNAILNLPLSEIIMLIKEELSDSHSSSFEYLVPTLNVSYVRNYYEDFRGLRITIDEDINFKSHLSMLEPLNINRQFAYGNKIVELKFDPSCKNEVSELIRPLRLTPVRHSKYLTGLAMSGQALYL
jgi:hypothetical protein